MDNPYAPPPDSQRGRPTSPHPPDGPPGRRGLADEDRRRPTRPEAVERAPRGPRPRPSPQQIRTASRRTFAATATTLGPLVVTGLPMPWPALGLPLSVAAVVLGIRAILAVRAAGLHRALLPVLGVGLALALLYVGYSLTILATWSVHQDRQECLARALTVSARDACNTEFREKLRGLSRDDS